MNRKSVLFVALMQLSLGCSGQVSGLSIGGSNGGPSGPGAVTPGLPNNPTGPIDPTVPYTPDMPLPSGPLVPAETTAQRLTKLEFTNTLRDALSVTAADLGFPEDKRTPNGFDKGLQDKALGLIEAKGFLDIAEEVAFKRLDANKIAGCTLDAKNGAKCAEGYLQGAAWKLFRRPLNQAEVDTYIKIFNAELTASSDAGVSFRTMVAAMLMSPNFQYRSEIGADLTPPTQVQSLVLSPFEIASALSYLLWNTIPDEELFAAAKAGSLSTPADLEKQVLRLLADARAKDFADLFTAGFLTMGVGSTIAKDTGKFPNYSPAVALQLQKETKQFVRETLLDGQGNFSTLMKSDAAYVTKATAPFYGLDAANFSDAPQRATLDSSVFSGVLTQPAFIGSRTHAAKTSPVHVGVYMLSQVLCIRIGTPPANANDVDNALPLPPNPTNRDRYEARIQNKNCAGCHKVIEPIGLAFDAFDPTGKPVPAGSVDTSGSIRGSDKDDQDFASPADFAQKLANSQQVQSCFARQLFRYAHGRVDVETDEPVIANLGAQFHKEHGGNLGKLVASVLSHPAFVTRTVTP
jgi:hypothetical protein